MYRSKVFISELQFLNRSYVSVEEMFRAIFSLLSITQLARLNQAASEPVRRTRLANRCWFRGCRQYIVIDLGLRVDH